MELDDYQQEARTTMVGHRHFGLFDEMGVGKTPPAIRAMTDVGGRWLVTIPAYLATNWMRELAIWAPDVVVSNAIRETNREEALNAPADIVLVSYHQWNLHPTIRKSKWTGMLFDESHRLRGRNSQWTRRVFESQNVEAKSRDAWRWFMTGTPIVRDAGDVWPFFYTCDRVKYRSYWRFVETHCQIIETPWEREIGPVRDAYAFASELSNYSMRRLLKDIPKLAHLEHVDKLIITPLPPAVAKAFRDAKRDYVMGTTVYESGGAMIQDLLRLCSNPPGSVNPKLSALKDYLTFEAPARVVVFCWYRDTAKLLVDAIGKRCVGAITGDTPLSRRDHILNVFEEKPNGVLVANISAAGSGLNFQMAARAVFFEESELPSENEQAIGRLKRRGQTELVRVHRFITDGLESSKHRRIEARQTNIRHALLEEFLHDDV